METLQANGLVYDSPGSSAESAPSLGILKKISRAEGVMYIISIENSDVIGLNYTERLQRSI